MRFGRMYYTSSVRWNKKGRRFLGIGQKKKLFIIQRNCFQQDIRRHEYLIAGTKTVVLMSVIGMQFYESIGAIVVCIPLGFWYFRKWEQECTEQKKRIFRQQFQEAIQSISASLNVGYSLENAMREAKKDLDVLYDADTIIQKEFNYMLRQIYIQIPIEQVLEEWAGRMELEEVRSFVNVFSMAKRSGGDMIGIIRNSVTQIRDKMDVQMEIETILAARKYEFKVMSVIPLGIIAYMKWSFPEFMGLLYGDVLGIGVMSICLAIYIGAYFLGERIVNIEI